MWVTVLPIGVLDQLPQAPLTLESGVQWRTFLVYESSIQLQLSDLLINEAEGYQMGPENNLKLVPECSKPLRV